MSLRKKTILAIAITFFLTLVVGYLYTHTLFMKGYQKLEDQEINANIRRFNSTLENEIETLGKLTNDWAAWDDTYQFIQNQGEDYISSNLVDGTYSELGLNFSFFLDRNGNAVFSKAYDLEADTVVPVDDSIYSHIKNLVTTSPITQAGDLHQGILSNEGLPVIFTARPILTSLDEGPALGTLVFGKYFSGVVLEHVLTSVDSEVKILPYTPGNIATLSHLNKNNDIWINKGRQDKVIFYSLINDTKDVPIFIIEQTLPRMIYQQGLISRREFMISLLLGCIIASSIALTGLEFGLLRRFSKLIRGVNDFGTIRQNKKDMILKGNDEISNLSIEMFNALTQLAETQKEITTHLDFEKLLVGISTKFINLPIEKINEGIDRLLKVIGEFSEVDRSYILLLRENSSRTLDNSHEWCAQDIETLKGIRQNIKANNLKWWFKNLQKGKSVIIDDISNLPDEAKDEIVYFSNQFVQSHTSVPLIIGGKFIGLLAYDSIRNKKKWSEQTILMLEVISTVIASAIDRKRHESMIMLNQINSTNLNKIISASIGSSTINAACREISIHLDSLNSSDTSYLILSDGKSDFEIFSGGHKLHPNNEKRKSINTLLKKSHFDAIQLKDLDSSEDLQSYHWLGNAFLSTPLISDEANLGILVFAHNNPHIFSNEEIEFYRQAATQINLIILKTKALESARLKSAELNALRATIADVTSELELQKLLHTLLERAIKLMKADGGDFCMVDEESTGLKVVASINLDNQYVGTQIKYGEGASGKVLETRKTLLLEDYSSWQGRLGILDATKLRSTVVMPLKKGQSILGTLGIFHSNPDHQFTSDDLHMLSLFAQHASIAIENSMLFERVQQMARIDEVTGLYNRRAFNSMGEYEINRAHRLNHAISLAMIDLDNFKQVNDQFSHQVGDNVLREIARFCREQIRNIDIMGRYGGDEMVILMPETDFENAYTAMERLRKAIETTHFKVGNHSFKITTSIGVTSHIEKPPPLNEIIDQADISMYTAKREGKNCVRMFQNLEGFKK